MKGRVFIMARKQTFKRRPNKAGTVVKLSGKRRKPFCAKITDGYNIITGKQIQKIIGTFETRQEALDALSLYSLTQKKMFSQNQLNQIGGTTFETVMSFSNRDLPTFEEIYNILFEKEFTRLSRSRQVALNSALKRLNNICNKQIHTINLFDMQNCVDISKKEVGSKVLNDMKTICTKVFEYAVIHQYIDRNSDFTQYIDVSKKEKKSDKHKPFTKEEITLIANDRSFEAQTVMLFILTGARPIELLNINTDNIFINDDVSYMITGSKTDAGRNRVIPIHNHIKPFVVDMIKKHKDYLIMPSDRDITQKYRVSLFYPLMKKLGMVHTPYDARHTFATLAKSYKVDDYCRKKIMGHKSNDLTDDVYTHAFIDELFKEINKIKIG